MNDIKKINAEQFRACQKDPAHCVVDVRDRQEYAAGSEASVCWPVSEINGESIGEFVKAQKISPEQTLVLLCARGMRASQAAEKLRPLIPNPIAVVEGGHAALASGTAQKISIERQVRIAAGALVLLGVIGSYIHPALIFIAAFVGGGLMFAGITDWCGMGLLMMKMPWNNMNKINEHKSS
jgi:rhodanese-related sulfurtransferase